MQKPAKLPPLTNLKHYEEDKHLTPDVVEQITPLHPDDNCPICYNIMRDMPEGTVLKKDTLPSG
jgi:hypothetical protein